MAKYRCPICGSPHKEPVEVCRQCGASMSDPPPTSAGSFDRAADAERFRSKSVLPYVFAGLAVVAVLAVTAVALGIVRGGDSVTEFTQDLTQAEKADGWIVFEEPEGVFTAKMPGEPETPDGRTLPTPDGGSVDAAWYGRELTDHLMVSVAYSQGAGLPEEDPYETLTAIAGQLATGPSGDIADEPRETSHQGRPAIDFEVDDITIDSVPVHQEFRLVLLESGEVLMVSTTSTDDNAEQYRRIVGSLDLAPDDEQT